MKYRNYYYNQNESEFKYRSLKLAFQGQRIESKDGQKNSPSRLRINVMPNYNAEINLFPLTFGGNALQNMKYRELHLITVKNTIHIIYMKC